MGIIGGQAAAIDQRIDGTRTADYAPARPIDGAPVEARIRQRLVLPIDRPVGKCPSIADGCLDPKSSIAAAGFQHQDPVAAACRQTIGQHAARRARADDYVVEGLHLASLAFRSRCAMPFRDSPMLFFEPVAPSRNGVEQCMVLRLSQTQGCPA